MKRILVAVGCDAYDRMDCLEGAERDAAAMYRQLMAPHGDYDTDSSVLMFSPRASEIIDALAKLPFGSDDVESLTFVFAGHGGEKAGAYYLCARDTDPSRLSTTGLAVSRLFSVLTELKPLQANILIDACQSGGAMFDTAALLRAEALGIGGPGSMSIAFLAACGPNEYAAETPRGGELTQRVLSYLNGDATLQTTRPSLDLIDLGRRVSAELTRSVVDQLPVSWGINLTGEGRFAPNPHFSPATEDLGKAASVLSSSILSDRQRNALQLHAFELWKLHHDLENEVDVGSLRRTLESVVATLSDDAAATVATLRGLATSLRAAAASSADAFAESLVLFACAEPLLGLLDNAAAAQVARQLLDEALVAQAECRDWLIRHLASDRYSLLSDRNGIADLYFLPLRLSRILGWLAIGLEVTRLAGRSDADAERETRDIASLLVDHYSTSLVPRSDAQSPHVLAFIETARRCGWIELAEQIAGCYFAGFLEVKGVIARPDLPDDDAFVFSLALGAGPEYVEHRFRANPTQFLSVLLICGTTLQMDDDWDSELEQLDHEGGYLFVPASYVDLADNVIEAGNNFAFEIGQDVFSIGDFRSLLPKIASHVDAALKSTSSLAQALALIASCLQPDRLPLHVVELRSDD